MTRPSAEIRRQVVERARGCCEYCLVHQDLVASTHQVDHVIAEKHRGETTMDNLALSCTLCHRRKGSDITSVDSETGEVISLFNPRAQRWLDHFEVDGVRIIGKTPEGRRWSNSSDSTHSSELSSGPNGLAPGFSRLRGEVSRELVAGAGFEPATFGL